MSDNWQKLVSLLKNLFLRNFKIDEIKYVCNLTGNKVQEFIEEFNNMPLLNSSSFKDATDQLNKKYSGPWTK